MGEVTDRINKLALDKLFNPRQAVLMPEERISAIEARLADIVQTLRDMREDHRVAMAKIEQAQAGCRERCDVSRSAVYDRIREIEGEQKVNRGAHEQIATEKARHPHVHVAGATYAVFAITAILVLVEIVKIWKG